MTSHHTTDSPRAVHHRTTAPDACIWCWLGEVMRTPVPPCEDPPASNE